MKMGISQRAAVVGVCMFLFTPALVQAATTYNFNSDTIGATPANITVTAGTFDVQDEATLGKSMRAATQVGVIAGMIFSNFASTTDQSVVWKQAYGNNMGRGGFTLRAQSTDTGVANSAGARTGYLFQVYDSNSVYIWRVGSATYTSLWSGSLTKAQPRWFKAIAQGTALGFYYSDDGTTYTRLASTTDSTYTDGLVQYTAGYGLAVARDYVDDVVITDLSAPADSTAPTVSYLSPADGATGVGVNATFEIAFNENVATTSSGSILLKKVSDDSTVETIAATSNKITASSTTAFVINPATTLDSETAYYFQVNSTVFEDTAGNDYAGIANTTAWNFTTADVVAPTISSLLPADDSGSVATNANLVLTFSESVTVGTGNLYIKKLSNNETVATVDVASGSVTGSGTAVITVNPSSDLGNGTAYYVVVDATAFDDASGNGYTGISDTATWNFSTVDGKRSGTSSVSSRVKNLLGMGKQQDAAALLARFPSAIAASEPSPLATTESKTCVLSGVQRTLRAGAVGEEVRALQRFLNCAGFPVAATGAGSPGNETTLFSVKTYNALVKYQEAHAADVLTPLGLTRGTGVLGELTRKRANGV